MIAYDTDISSATPALAQFENVNEGRSYPFDGDSELTSTDGRVLPDNVIADLHLVLPEGTNASLSSVYVSEHMVSACVLAHGSGFTEALSVRIRREDFEPYRPYRLEQVTGSSDCSGIMTFGNIDLPEASGSYRFAPDSVTFVDSVCTKFKPAGLRRLIDDRTGESVAGDVSIDFSQYVAAERSLDGIRLYLKDGANNILLSKCDKDKPMNACGTTPIASINGVYPDEQNRIVLWFH